MKENIKTYDQPHYLLRNEKSLIGFSILAILLYYLPYVILGKDSTLLILDNLDIAVPMTKILLESGKIFSSPSAEIEQLLNGIPRSSLYGTYDISLLWFKIFGIYGGYVFSKILMSFAGFFGMFFLLKNHLLPKNAPVFIHPSVALLFSLLPFSSSLMSVAGLPLLLNAFLNIRNQEKHFSSWVVIIIFPFYSLLFISGIFFMILLAVLFIYDYWKSKKINHPFVLGIVLLGCLYCISHFPIFYSVLFNSQYASHRNEFTTLGKTFIGTVKAILGIFIKGQFHAHSLHTYILIPITLGIYLAIRSKEINKKHLLILLFLIITSLFYGILNWTFLIPITNKLMSVLPIQLQRFHFLHPMFWYVLLSASLVLISQQIKFGHQIAGIIIVLQLAYIVSKHELIVNRAGPSFRQFYSEEQFEEIRSYINRPQNSYRVISIGIHPAIAQFNGFYTLDGYVTDYPREYKHKFREIIGGELERDTKIKNYFNNWGSRCYAFSTELGINFENTKASKIKRLEYNWDAFKKMGGVYILSRSEIETSENKKVVLERIFNKTPDAHWDIYLYKAQ